MFFALAHPFSYFLLKLPGIAVRLNHADVASSWRSDIPAIADDQLSLTVEAIVAMKRMAETRNDFTAAANVAYKLYQSLSEAKEGTVDDMLEQRLWLDAYSGIWIC
jgi:hypothetical protein